MFRVITTQLRDSCRQMERQIRNLSCEEEELERVIMTLSALSGMGNIIPQLQKELRIMQEEEQILRQMLQVLSKVLSHYMNCENRILSEFEQSTFTFHPKDMGMFEIPEGSSLVR